MPTILEKVSIVTHAVRTGIAVAVVTGLGAAGWYGYELIEAGGRTARALADAEQQLQTQLEEIDSLQVQVRERDLEIHRLETAMRLLKIDHRVALLSVLEQEIDPVSELLVSDIIFQELDDEGQPMDPGKRFRIPGDVIYLDSWIVKFDDEYVERADLHRSTSLVLFRRIFGEEQRPSEGSPLDEVGSRPKIYARADFLSEWEQQIWGDFWAVANDRQKQEELGIRAAHGEAVSIKVQAGKTYRITLRASDGLSVGVDETPPPRSLPPAA